MDEKLKTFHEFDNSDDPQNLVSHRPASFEDIGIGGHDHTLI